MKQEQRPELREKSGDYQSYISLVAEVRKSFYDRSEQETVQTFLDAAALHFDCGKVWYGVRIGDAIRPAFHSGPSQRSVDFSPLNLVIAKGKSSFPFAPAVLTRQPFVLRNLHPSSDDSTEANLWNEFLKRTCFRSALAVPVEISGTIESMIVFYSLRADAFDDLVIGYLDGSVRELAQIISGKRHWARQLRTLKKARENAEAAAVAKTQFLANMSHEIRTPMTSILGYTEMMLDGFPTIEDVSSEDCRRIVAECRNTAKVVQSNAEFLLAILNDILDLSKMEAGKLTVEQCDVSLRPFLADIALYHSIQAKTKKLEFSIRSVTPLPETIRTDPIRMKQILVNLIGNAIKFTVEGRVTVSIAWVPEEPIEIRLRASILDEPCKGTLLFSVKDTGIGIAPEHLAMLFRPFQQGDVSTMRRFGGTGLGLAISEQLANLLDGDLTVSSQVGQGSTFTVSLPQTLPEGTILALVDEQCEPSDRKIRTVKAPPVHREAATLPLAGLHVLLAEDGKDSQRLFALVLTKAGAKVCTAENGFDAYSSALERHKEGVPFDVILMDIQMPVMDGYAATAKLRESGYGAPIIALTAHAMPEERQRCLAIGCDDYATKPILRDALIAAVLRNVRKGAKE